MKRKELKNIFEVQTQKEYFPIPLKDIGAHVQFITKEESVSRIIGENTVDFSYRLHSTLEEHSVMSLMPLAKASGSSSKFLIIKPPQFWLLMKAVNTGVA